MHAIHDILYIVILRNDDLLREFQDDSQIPQNLNFRSKSEGLEMYDKNSSSRTVGEAFGVSKDQIQKLVKRKAEVLEEYNGNTPSHSRCIRRKTDNDEINELIWRYHIPGSRYGPTGHECHIKNEFVIFYVIRTVCMYILTIRYTHMNIL